MCMRVWARVLTLAMVLQATSAGFVPACDMYAKLKVRSCPQCPVVAKAPSCHGTAAAQNAPLKACCFFGVMLPCADGAVGEARLTAPAPAAAPVAIAIATPAWESPAITISVAVPPGIAELATGPPRTTVLLI